MCILTLATEMYQDRFGETPRDKVEDAIVLLIAFTLTEFISIKMGMPWWKVPLLTIGLRTMFFDYGMNIILWHNKVIEHPSAKRWWEYLGKTAETDKLNWWVDIGWKRRLLIRAVVFLGCLIAYMYGEGSQNFE